MMNDYELVKEVIDGNRYLTLSTTNGTEPWIAPLEYFRDDENLYFLSPDDSRHAQHIASNPTVAVAIFDAEQPEYNVGATFTLRGVQIKATARRLDEGAYPPAVREVIEALKPPMPPYAAFAITPVEYYVPQIDDGINKRVKVDVK